MAMKILPVLFLLLPLFSFAEDKNSGDEKVCLINTKPNSMRGPEKRMAKIVEKLTKEIEEDNCQKGDILFMYESVESNLHASLLCDSDTLTGSDTTYICKYIGYVRQQRTAGK